MGANGKARANAAAVVLVVVIGAVIVGIGMPAITVTNKRLAPALVGAAGPELERWVKRPHGVRDKPVDRMGCQHRLYTGHKTFRSEYKEDVAGINATLDKVLGAKAAVN